MSKLHLAFAFHEDRCIQCHGCELACSFWRTLEQSVKWRRVINIWRGEYPQVTCSSLSVSCLHCSDPACVASCPAQAISKRESDGAVLVDRDKCIGCRVCADACAYGVPQFGADGLMQKCDMCTPLYTHASEAYIPPCVRTCPTCALEMVRMTPDQKSKTERDALLALKDANADRI